MGGDERKFQEPVAWLLGPQLIGSLKNIVVHAFYKGLDIRDWMHPMAPLDMAKECKHEDKQPFWFDYLADSGDGQVQTFAVAYMCMAELAISSEAIGADATVLTESRTLRPGETRLPRGSFLFVGGDTAYHVADHSTLRSRFQTPFLWAHADLLAAKADGDWKTLRPLIAIPGNHDYYDMLDGFNRQFRKPVTERIADCAEERASELELPTFRRLQEASYFAAALPFGWWIYGIDTEQDAVDFRQKAYFKAILGADGKPPKKLIVATPTPTTVFHRRPTRDEDVVTPFRELELPMPFVADKPDAIAPGECRLDLSGDVHHYARYWGSDSSNGKAPSNPSYASVVSGLGGAFHHPSTTVHGDLAAQQMYPTPEKSRQAVAKRLFRPWTIMRGGYARGIGAFTAALITGAFLVRGSTRWVVERVLTMLTGVGFDPLPDVGKVALRSLYVVGSLLVLIGTIIFVAKLATRLYKRSQDTGESSPYWVCFLAMYIAIAFFVFTLWKARTVPAGAVAFDVTLYLFVLAFAVGLLVFACKVGAAGRGLRVTTGFGWLGLWHLLMQLVPIALLIKIGTPLAYALTILSWSVFLVLGWWSVRSASRWLALLTWLGFGLSLLAIPIIFHVDSAGEPKGWTLVGLLVIAIAFGFVHTCIQLAWYLAVSLGFNGHNNEVGGATRIGDFKQFIRFRVDENSITGYVIAVDHPLPQGSQLVAKVRDVFTLETRSPGGGV